MREAVLPLVAALLALAVAPAQALCIGPKPANYCANGYGTWSATNWPPGCSQIYDPNGPWNTPIPPNPAIDPASPAIMNWLYNLDCCRGGMFGDQGWGHYGCASIPCVFVLTSSCAHSLAHVKVPCGCVSPSISASLRTRCHITTVAILSTSRNHQIHSLR